ncbi:Potassium channel AKT1 [Seminavis robusta]|uniref:Potassium channel AKT1 n=1 Tax=Seminavis robusta TaxID=568900 RepID=A0A9N8EMW4_9STRA|nr:Potassium channel AKT1 [Seminavis robusta]|eukprot:Sro1495_g277400.1 Potassium channel AKT1 (811) ;mRNA; r:3844-6360
MNNVDELSSHHQQDGHQKQPLILRRKFSRKSSSCTIENAEDARHALATRPSGVRGGASTNMATTNDQELVEKANIRGILFPWTPAYKIWWYATIVGAMFTVFFAPYQVAFEATPGTLNRFSVTGWIEVGLNLLFTIDIVVNCHLAIYKDEMIVYDRKQIFWEYVHGGMFWVDVIGVFPFETVALLLSGELGETTTLALLFSFLRLIRFVRLHRIAKLSEMLQYNARVSLLASTLLRNFAVVLTCAHLEACCMFFLARIYNFDETTWLGPIVHDMTGFQRYVTSLYWSIVTFCTVGYGDFSPSNSSEQIVGSIFMLVNIVVAAWIIGSITLLIVKGDEKTGEYRDSLETLHQYGAMHQFDPPFLNKLQRQLSLEFNNREIADEQVLKNFPSALRRKILRKLYLQPLIKTQLMKGVRQQFVDAFLTSCTVEIFSPGEDIVERGSILSDLFLLVGGIAEVTTPDLVAQSKDEVDNDNATTRHGTGRLVEGDFIGEIGFFTESPQVDSVTSLTVCKTLTMSRSAYKLLAQDHPGSVGKILHNLLKKVEGMALQLDLPKRLTVLRAGSDFDIEAGYGTLKYNHNTSNNNSLSRRETEAIFRRHESLTAIEDLVKMHMSKQLDDQTTKLLFAASRGDTSTISLFMVHGFDPNNTDYDHRSALMVASMKGNTDVAKLLLEYKANPNLKDMHGSSALLEAVKNGHETTMALLSTYGADLCMPESRAASVLCQAVFDGDILLLRRLLKAGIDSNAADYDMRTAAHIAAAEGNVAAIRVLAEHGADLTLKDRWNNTVQDEARRSNARQLLEFLEERRNPN